MEKIEIVFKSDGNFRPSETLPDLRSAAEALFFPMKMCGFLDESDNMHLCPQEERKQPCPHVLEDKTVSEAEYRRTLERERKASLRVFFTHAGISVYLT